MGAHSKGIPNVIEATEYIANEIPVGLINSLNDEFTLAQTPIGTSITLYLNGQQLIQGESYTVSGNTITFMKPPRTGSKISATYIFNS